MKLNVSWTGARNSLGESWQTAQLVERLTLAQVAGQAELMRLINAPAFSLSSRALALAFARRRPLVSRAGANFRPGGPCLCSCQWAIEARAAAHRPGELPWQRNLAQATQADANLSPN